MFIETISISATLVLISSLSNVSSCPGHISPLYIRLSQHKAKVSCKTNRIMYGGSIDVPFMIQASWRVWELGVPAVIRLRAKELIDQSPRTNSSNHLYGRQNIVFLKELLVEDEISN
jgi:hypothetical protein